MQMHLPLADRKLILHFLVMRAQQQNDLITGVWNEHIQRFFNFQFNFAALAQ